VARKTSRRRQPPPKTRRPAGGSGTGTGVAPVRPAADARRVGGDQATVRSVEMSLSPGAPSSRRGGRIVLDSGDPAIPLDRVPYFVADLRRLGLVAASMLVLLVVGALFVVPLFLR
jgi:hypothetical protein